MVGTLVGMLYLVSLAMGLRRFFVGLAFFACLMQGVVRAEISVHDGLDAAKMSDIPASYISQVLDIYLRDHAELKSDPSRAYQFADHYVLPRLDLPALTLHLLGKSVAQELTREQREALFGVLRAQAIRYVMEAIDQHQGAEIRLQKIEFNSLQMAIEPKLLPSTLVSLALNQTGSNWGVDDFSVAGISYCKLKQHQYASVIEQSGIDGLIHVLDEKNRAYFHKKGLTV